MTQLQKLIIEKNNLPLIAKRAHGDSPEITSEDLIEAILLAASGVEAAKLLEIGEQTFNRIIFKNFVPIFGKLSGGNLTWKYILLKSIEHKECKRCKEIKSYSKFGNDSYRSDGKFLICRYCRSFDNASLYSKRKLRIPPWYDLEKDKIAEFYDNCPEGYHVDHVIPLQGRLVSGLHVLSNLQYLPACENIRKGNEYCPDGEIR